MAECVKCGTRLDEGITRCPQCGATLASPGAFLQACSWVAVCVSTIPLSVGALVFPQRVYTPLAIGIAMLAAGIVGLIVARARNALAPSPVRPALKAGGPAPEGSI
jgi:uncharacterized membrane protein YvbJ